MSFRRCSGYVEQFDVQSPQLTVRETVLFSARLRLNSEDPAVAGDDIKQRYTEQVLRILELTALADSIVGMDGQGGLSFEQRKRLSIAVELAASPSIIFLDEVSGLHEYDLYSSNVLTLSHISVSFCSRHLAWILGQQCLWSRYFERLPTKVERLWQRFTNRAVPFSKCL